MPLPLLCMRPMVATFRGPPRTARAQTGQAAEASPMQRPGTQRVHAGARPRKPEHCQATIQIAAVDVRCIAGFARMKQAGQIAAGASRAAPVAQVRKERELEIMTHVPALPHG